MSGDAETVRAALAFHESVIKSGEGYTETVVLHTTLARDALDRLVGRAADAEKALAVAEEDIALIADWLEDELAAGLQIPLPILAALAFSPAVLYEDSRSPVEVTVRLPDSFLDVVDGQ